MIINQVKGKEEVREYKEKGGLSLSEDYSDYYLGT